MKIRNKKTGEIVEITNLKQLAKYGLSVPKAQEGDNIPYTENNYPMSMRPVVGNYDYNQPLFNWSEGQFQNLQPNSEQTSTPIKKNKFQTNIQGNRSSTETFLTGLSNLPEAIKDPSNPAAWAAVGDLPMTGTKAILEPIEAKKTNNRLNKQSVEQFQDAQTLNFLNNYNDSQFGTTNIGMAKYGIKLPQVGHGATIPSKFKGKTHGEGGIPINTNLPFENANDLKVPRQFATLEVEGNGENSPEGEYLLPQAEMGAQEPSMGILSAQKKVGFTMKGKNGKSKKVSPSEAVDEMAKIEGIPTPDKMNKFITKRDKFIEDNKQMDFLGTQEAIDILMPKYKAKIDPITDLAFNLQEQRKEQLGISDAPQAKYGGKASKFKMPMAKYGATDENKKEKKTRAQRVEEKWNKDFELKDYTKKGYNTAIQDNTDNGVDSPDNMFYGQPQVVPQQLVNHQVVTQPQITQPLQNPAFNYNIQPDVRRLNPNYSKMGQQTTPTGVKYEPLTPQDIADWKSIEHQLNTNHPNAVPFSDNKEGYYKDKDGKPITDKQQLTNLGYQEQYYDDMLETPQGRTELAKMWQEKGKTLKGIKLPTKTDDLTSLGDQELYDRLNSLRPAYLDSYPKIRKGSKYYNPNPTATSKATPKVLTKPLKPSDKLEIPSSTPIEKGKYNNKGFKAIPVVQPFQEPYLESPVARFTFNPNLIDYRNQNPDFTEIDRQYQGAKTGDPRIDANLFAKTLNAKNQIAFGTQAQNRQGQMQVDQYNAGALDRLQQLQYGEDNTYRGLVNQMRGALNTQKLMDRSIAQSNAQKQMDYYNFALPTIETLYGVDPNEQYIKKGNPLSAYTTEKTKEVKKYGGKIKPKFKKKSSK